jgi:hypothetical protein
MSWSAKATARRAVVSRRHRSRAHGHYAIEKLLEMTAQSIPIVSGVLADECAAVYFSSVR